MLKGKAYLRKGALKENNDRPTEGKIFRLFRLGKLKIRIRYACDLADTVFT